MSRDYTFSIFLNLTFTHTHTYTHTHTHTHTHVEWKEMEILHSSCMEVQVDAAQGFLFLTYITPVYGHGVWHLRWGAAYHKACTYKGQ